MSLSESVAASATMPLGIFGGTFDPVHLGHLRLAEEARMALGLAGVRWIPAGAPPLRAVPRTSAAHRLAMVERAIAGNPGFSLDAAEVRADRASYTVHTLERLRAEFGPERSLVLLLGADALARLDQWHEWRRLFALAHIGVATRPGHDLAKVGGETGVARSTASRLSNGLATGQHSTSDAGDTALGAELRRRTRAASALGESPAGAIVPFALTALDISATAIRTMLAAGASARYLVSDGVLDYIQQHSLYR